MYIDVPYIYIYSIYLFIGAILSTVLGGSPMTALFLGAEAKAADTLVSCDTAQVSWGCENKRIRWLVNEYRGLCYPMNWGL